MTHKHQWCVVVLPAQSAVGVVCECGASEAMPTELVIKFIRNQAAYQRAAQRAVARHTQYDEERKQKAERERAEYEACGYYPGRPVVPSDPYYEIEYIKFTRSWEVIFLERGAMSHTPDRFKLGTHSSREAALAAISTHAKQYGIPTVYVLEHPVYER